MADRAVELGDRHGIADQLHSDHAIMAKHKQVVLS